MSNKFETFFPRSKVALIKGVGQCPFGCTFYETLEVSGMISSQIDPWGQWHIRWFLVIALTKTIEIMETIMWFCWFFSFSSFNVTIIFTWLIIVIHTDRRQTTLGVEHKTSKNNHSCCLLAISVENYFTWRSQLSISNFAVTYQITLLILRYISSKSPKRTKSKKIC